MEFSPMKILQHYKTQFVPAIPGQLKEGILYICIPYNTAAHLCACGCKSEIFTPISKQYGWIVSYDGDNASLSPSIGNGAYPCHSHYFLRNGDVEWLPPIGISSQLAQAAKKKHSIFDFFKKLLK